MPDYLATFAFFGAVAAVGGVIVAAVTDAPLLGGAAYGVMLLGTVFLLTGGASGGGYSNIGVGAVGALFGGRQRADDDPDDPDVRRGRPSRRDPMERLKRGLRPGRNPRAFWQVIGGIAYLAIGLGVLNAIG